MAEVQTKDVDAMEVMSRAFTGPYEQTRDQLDGLMSWLLRVGHPYSDDPLGLYYDDPQKVEPENLRAEVCLPIEEACEGGDDVVRKELPAVTVASTVYTGPISGVSAVYPEIFAWIEEHSYEYVEGEPTREVFIQLPEDDPDDPTTAIIEVQVPIKSE